jgi:hypothetical protein
MLAQWVLVFEESPGEGFIDHGYGASVALSSFRMTKERSVFPRGFGG